MILVEATCPIYPTLDEKDPAILAVAFGTDGHLTRRGASKESGASGSVSQLI